MALAQDLRIAQVPTLMAIVGGRGVNQTVGFAVRFQLFFLPVWSSS